jgi:hypothetical protein
MTFVEFVPYVSGVQKGRQRRDAWLAWHTAALYRSKRMPALKRLLPTDRSDERKLQRDILHVFHGINARNEAKERIKT